MHCAVCSTEWNIIAFVVQKIYCCFFSSSHSWFFFLGLNSVDNKFVLEEGHDLQETAKTTALKAQDRWKQKGRALNVFFIGQNLSSSF